MRLAITDFGGTGDLLVLGPSLGTAVRTLWSAAAERLTGRFHVLGWDLPGHGGSVPAASAFTIADLASAVAAAVDGPFAYAGVSLGGTVGLQLLLDAPERVGAATLIATGARIGEPAGWHERAVRVRAEGMAFLVEASPARWFAPASRGGAAAEALLADLAAADPPSYAAACEALAGFDLRSRLAEITAPGLAVAGAHDPVTTAQTLRHVATGVQHGRLVVLDGAAHLIPAELPDEVATLVGDHEPPHDTTLARLRADGMRTRREVLGDAHVDRATAAADEVTAEFQDLVARYAWGTVWNRPGLDRRSRSMITLTALVARGHDEELALHLRGALRNGLSRDEITEVLLHAAVYCGVPAANSAFRIAQRVFAEQGGS